VLVKRKRDIMNFGLLIVTFALKAAGYKARMTDVRWTTRATENSPRKQPTSREVATCSRNVGCFLRLYREGKIKITRATKNKVER